MSQPKHKSTLKRWRLEIVLMAGNEEIMRFDESQYRVAKDMVENRNDVLDQPAGDWDVTALESLRQRRIDELLEASKRERLGNMAVQQQRQQRMDRLQSLTDCGQQKSTPGSGDRSDLDSRWRTYDELPEDIQDKSGGEA